MKIVLGIAAFLAALGTLAQARSETAWPDLKDANSYTFAANRLSFPSMIANKVSVGLSHVMQVSPPYPVSNYRLLFANFYVPGNAQANPESCPGNPKTVDFASVLLGDKWYSITFNGAGSTRIADCEFVWSDPLRDAEGRIVTIPAGTTYFIRSSQSVEPGQNLTIGVDYLTIWPRFENWASGSGVEYSSSVQQNKQAGGRVKPYSGGSAFSGPSMAIGTGWDGSPVYLVTGDSIAAGQNDLDFTGNGITGYIGRALDDAGSTRRNFANLAVPGTRPTDQASTEPGQFQLRDRVLRSIPNRPFNRIITNMGNNSLALPSDAFKTAMRAYWAYLHDLGGAHTPIYQTTYGPQTAQIDNSWFTTLDGQTSSGGLNAYPAGKRWQAIRWLQSDEGVPPYVTPIDITSAVTAPDEPAKFRLIPGSWTLTEPVGEGAGVTTGIEVTGDRPPQVGDHFVIEPGSENFDRLQAYRVTGNGPWTVFFSSATRKSHEAGAPILAAPTVDGIHFGTSTSKAAAAALIARKRDGSLR